MSFPLAGVILYSPDAPALTTFLREKVGIPLALHRHGPTREHQEALHEGVHFAIWPATAARAVPTFRVPELDAAVARAVTAGAKQLHPTLDLGEGKRLVSLAVADVELRYIEIR